MLQVYSISFAFLATVRAKDLKSYIYLYKDEALSMELVYILFLNFFWLLFLLFLLVKAHPGLELKRTNVEIKIEVMFYIHIYTYICIDSKDTAID